jgi:cell division protein FtsB
MKTKNNYLYNLVDNYQISKNLFIFYFVCFGLIIYFLITAFFGAKGFLAYKEVLHNFNDLQFTKEMIRQNFQMKAKAVEHMNLQSLDLDLVDEQSRKILGYINKNEVVLYRKNK